MDFEVIFSDEVNTKHNLVDYYDSQISELAEIRNPQAGKTELLNLVEGVKKSVQPVFVQFPWRNKTVKLLPEKEFIEVKTNRNRELISIEEQKRLYYDTTVSIAGLSVGSSIVSGLAGSSVARRIILADYDSFSLSNLNRVSANVMEIGENKAIVAKRRALEMNPYLEISIITDPLNPDNLENFFDEGAVDVVFEEIDDFKMKLKIREMCADKNTPAVMLTNLGDSVQIDIERHDMGEYDAFHGTVDKQVYDQLMSAEEISPDLMKQLAVKLVSRENIPVRALDSLNEIGKTLVGRPQLYSTVAMDGGIAPFLIKKLLLNDDTLDSGRYLLSLEEMRRLDV